MSHTSEALFLPEVVALDYVSGAGNMEAKNLLSILALLELELDPTIAGLTNEMNRRQGESMAYMFPYARIYQYVERSLQPVAHVMEGFDLGELHTTREYPRQKLALAGFIGKWSLDWTGLSVQQVYGGSKSNSKHRAPSTRHRIYEAIVTHADEELSIFNISNLLGNEPAYTTVQHNIYVLDNICILRKDSNHRHHNPEVRIEHTELRTRSDTAPVTRALHEAVRHLGPGKLTTVNAIIDKAKELDGSMDPVSLGLHLRKYLYSENAFPGLRLLTDVLPHNDELSVVDVEDSVREPISKLVHGIASVRDGTKVDEYAAAAKDIADDPASFRDLVQKSLDFSPSANKQDRLTNYRRLESIIRTHGVVTADLAQAELARLYSVDYMPSNVRQLLNDMVDSGTLAAEKIRIDPYSKFKTKAYRLQDATIDA